MSDNEVHLITGDLAVDDRGVVRFVNDFDFAGVKRFYMVENHQAGFIRAWHAHRREGKYVLVVQGAAIVAAVKIEDWANPPHDSPVHRYVLSAHKPAVLWIPRGYANGFKSLTADTKLILFSTSTLEESRGDDVRWDPGWFGDDVWAVTER
jgi:dTDP-4-dehydrorhamnose 3,5-epimerase-like enzyme